MQAKRLLPLLSLLFVASACLFMTYNARGQWDFVLAFRSEKLLLLITIGYTIGVSTLLFQTLTHNPILTPSILGFDALYILVQSLLIFFFGGIGFTQLDQSGKFLFETLLMVSGALLLFRTLTKENVDLTKMILVGVIFGMLFRSLTNLLQRMIDPTEFAVAQGSYFAQFNTVNSDVLWIGIILAIVSAIWIWKQRHRLDVLLLGKSTATSLGIEYHRFSHQLLICSAILVSVSTALVGPILFLGLLVCAIVNAITRTMYHSVRIPVVFLISAITLILGQVVFEQVLGLQGVLSAVIEFIGGLVFIGLMYRQRKQG
ncbi:iron chelate uptake ABC transporter family permease subunit [Ursidibacter sp. B-7004-1]